MKRAATVLLCAVSLALPAAAHAVTLVGPSGQPVGGVWQQWADEAKTPTITGNLTLVVSDTRPCLAAGCSSSPVSLAIDDNNQLVAPWASNPTVTWMAPDAPQWTFYWELGHQFDWQRLTDADRHRLADLWRANTIPWWDSEAALYRGTEDGLESTFAAVYANCASGTLSVVPGGWVSLQLADPEASCMLINQIAGVSGAPVVSAVNVVATQHRVRQHRHRRSRSVLRRHRRA